MTTSPLSGPAHVPDKITHALICLHGFGADGDDLFGLTPHLTAATGKLGETLAIFCPSAPDETQIGQGRQWFNPMGFSFKDRPGMEKAATTLWDYIHYISDTYKLPYQNIAVLGFSQGGMVALFGIPRGKEKIGALIGHSTLAMWQEELDEKTCQKPPVLILHGLDDDIINADDSKHAAEGLRNLGFSVEHHMLPFLGHGFDTESIARIAVFLRQSWNISD
jgi:phospholipase/carboxylesterase